MAATLERLKLFLLRCTRFWRGFWIVSRNLAFRLGTVYLPAYQYAPLEDQDIRLVTVLPGSYDDDIALRIQHVALEPRNALPPSRLSVKEIQKTLSEPWIVRDTIEGRYLFLRQGANGDSNPTWDHPNLDMEHSEYGRHAEEPQPRACGVAFDALSYVWGTYSWLRQRRAFVECTEVSGAVPGASCPRFLVLGTLTTYCTAG